MLPIFCGIKIISDVLVLFLHPQIGCAPGFAFKSDTLFEWLHRLLSFFVPYVFFLQYENNDADFI